MELNMGFLKDKRVYLSGPIQFDDTNLNWRTEPKRRLTEGFGIDFFDPFDDPKQQWVPTLKHAQSIQDYPKMAEIAHRFVHKDLQMVARTDALIAYLPYKVPTTGTVHEIINSNENKKPTLLVTNMDDIAYIPLWYFGFIRLEFMFPNWDALFAYLSEVDEGKHRHNPRWSFIYGDV